MALPRGGKLIGRGRYTEASAPAISLKFLVSLLTSAEYEIDGAYVES